MPRLAFRITITMISRIRLLLLAVVLVSCSDGDVAVSQSQTVVEPTVLAAPTAIPAPTGLDSAGSPVTLEVVDGGLVTGMVITDHRGFPVYGAVDETIDALICVDDCLRSFVPVTPRSGTVTDRLDAEQYATIDRPDGITQATYQGIPLYTWTGDTEVGITSGAGIAGLWYALTETGGFLPDR